MANDCIVSLSMTQCGRGLSADLVMRMMLCFPIHSWRVVALLTFLISICPMHFFTSELQSFSISRVLYLVGTLYQCFLWERLGLIF